MRTLRRSIFQACLLLVLLLNFISGQAQTQGSLDPTFGDSGKVATHLFVQAQFKDMVLQPDGKIVVVGVTYATPPPGQPVGLQTAVVARFNQNGTLDTTFDGDGYNNSIFMGGANSVALQPDGKIVVGGGTSGGGGGVFSVARFNPDGTLDTTFDGDGTVITTIGIDAVGYSVNVQADGKIVLVGMTTLVPPFAQRDFAMVRYNADGSLDTSFGTGGRVATEVGTYTDVAFDSAIQADGKIVVVGYAVNPLPNLKSAAIVRYNTDGSLDTSFGTGGKVLRSGASDVIAEHVTIQPDGKIIIVGEGNPPLRYNPNGTLETIFQTSGSYTPMSVALQPNGKIVVGGWESVGGPSSFAIVRYQNDGTLDPTFGTGGKVLTSFASSTFVAALAIQADGKIVAGGTVLDDNFEIVLARYLGDSTSRAAVMDFDGDGKADVSVFRPTDGNWYLSRSTEGSTGVQFGAATDRLAPADFDGDGRTDIAVFRDGVWYWLGSSNNSFNAVQFGAAADVPVPADYTGDGRAELAVYRDGSWYTLNLANNQFQAVQFGLATDKPVPADFDGDGKTDFAVYRDGTWYTLGSTAGFTSVQFGVADDKPTVGDYDGDGKADEAVYRAGVWYVLGSTQGFSTTPFGNAGDLPVAADYDGDGKTDLAVFRDGAWYQLCSQQGFTAVQFGTTSDRPVPAAFVP